MTGKLIRDALAKGLSALSEYDSKKIIAAAGVPVTREELALDREDAARIASEIGFPVAMKGCSPHATHKTEMGLVMLNITGREEVLSAFDRINPGAADLDGVLVQEMVKGDREFVIGLVRDPQFGPCVMFGLGGIFTEALRDVTFRVAPLSRHDASDMIDEIKASKLLGSFRGGPPVDRQILEKALVGIGELGMRYEEISEIDINPLKVRGGSPVAVDALVVLSRIK